MKTINFIKLLSLVCMFVSLGMLTSCGDDDENSEREPTGLTAMEITIDPSVTHQQMLGLGGA